MTQLEHTYLHLQLTAEQFQAAHIACQEQGFTDLEGYLRTCLQHLTSGENVLTPPTARGSAIRDTLNELAQQWGLSHEGPHRAEGY